MKRDFVFISACFGMLLFGVAIISLGTILPSLAERFPEISSQGGLIASLLPFGILIGSVFFGPIVDRYGYKWLLIVSSLLIFLSLEGIAFASSIKVLLASVFTIGVSGGIINGGTNALVADISSDARGARLSILGVFFGIGALGMPVILGALSAFFSDAQIIAGVGYSVFFPIILFLIVRFPAPKHPQGIPFSKGANLFRDGTLLLLGFILFFQSGLEGLVSTWSTSFMEKEIISSKPDALFALSFYIFGLTMTRLFLGMILKRVSNKKALFFSIGISAAGSFILLQSENYGTAMAGLALLGIGAAAVFPVILGFAGDRYPHLSGTAFSIVLVIALSGNSLLNYIMGMMFETMPMRMLPGSIILILAVIIILLLIYLRVADKNSNAHGSAADKG